MCTKLPNCPFNAAKCGIWTRNLWHENMFNYHPTKCNCMFLIWRRISILLHTRRVLPKAGFVIKPLWWSLQHTWKWFLNWTLHFGSSCSRKGAKHLQGVLKKFWFFSLFSSKPFCKTCQIPPFPNKTIHAWINWIFYPQMTNAHQIQITPVATLILPQCTVAACFMLLILGLSFTLPRFLHAKLDLLLFS